MCLSPGWVRLVHPRHPPYVVPRGGGDYLVGATEIESDDSSLISARAALELLGAAYALHPGFAEARILDMRVGLRPALPDNEPALIATHGLLSVNGMYRLWVCRSGPRAPGGAQNGPGVGFLSAASKSL